MAKAMVVYASLTGNTEEIARTLGDKLEARGMEVLVEEAMQVEAEEMLDYDLCVVATYTYGTDGEIPDEIADFYDDLGELDLSGKVYGVLGSGQTFYEHFCRAVEYFDTQFQKTQAIKGADLLKFELDASSDEDIQKIDDFAGELFKRLKDVKSEIA